MEAIIGVVGTILGTILGWFLNSISQKGKLQFYIKQWEDKFECNEIGTIVECSTIDEAEWYSYSFNVDIYNSSSETKIMRDIFVVFSDGKNIIRKQVPQDGSSKRYAAHCYHYDKLNLINIPPKTVINVEMLDSEYDKENSIRNYLSTQKIYIQYTDEKNNTKKIYIVKNNYKNFFTRKENKN